MPFNSPIPSHPSGPTSGPNTPHGRDWTTGPAKYVLVAVLGAIAGTGLTWSILRDGRAPAPQTIRTVAPLASSSAPPSAPPAPIASDLPPPKTYDDSLAATRTNSPDTASVPTTPNVSTPGTINLNTATQAQIELLPGIGPALASRIIDHRTKNGPFKSISDLDAVSGIGPKMLEKIKPLVRFE